MVNIIKIKKNFIYCLFFIAAFIFLPFLAYLAPDGQSGAGTPSDIKKSGYVRITDFGSNEFDASEKKYLDVTTTDYIFGCVAAVCPPDSDKEVFKAAAVAVYTFLQSERGEKISADPVLSQPFITKETAFELWGNKKEAVEKVIKDACNAVRGEMLVYNKIVFPARIHAVSAGKTEDSETVFGKKINPLSSVNSIGDLLAPDYVSKASYSASDFISHAKNLGLELKNEPQGFISIPKQSGGGYVISYTLGGKSFTGLQMMEAFSLKSPNFDLSEKDGVLTFTTRGIGHGVGMSIYGAEYMAKEGSGYKDILLWYYKGAEVITNSE